MTSARPKCLYGRPLTGGMLARLACEYCRAMNDNQTPTIRSAWDRVADQQCEDAAEAAVALYKRTMDNLIRGGSGDGGAAGAGAPGSKPAAKGAAPVGAVTLLDRVVVDADVLTNLHCDALAAAKALFDKEAVAVRCDARTMGGGW